MCVLFIMSCVLFCMMIFCRDSGQSKKYGVDIYKMHSCNDREQALAIGFSFQLCKSIL